MPKYMSLKNAYIHVSEKCLCILISACVPIAQICIIEFKCLIFLFFFVQIYILLYKVYISEIRYYISHTDSVALYHNQKVVNFFWDYYTISQYNCPRFL